MNVSRFQIIMTGLIAILAVLITVSGLGAAVSTLFENEDGLGYLAWGLTTMAAGAFVLAGLFVIKSPWPAAAAIVVGTLVFVAAWYWMLVITVPVALVVASFALFTAKYLTGERRHV